MKTLLIGMGNPILSDDAVGVRLARDIGPRLSGVPGLAVLEECSVGGLNILEIVRGYGRLIVLDSIRTTGGKPGDWHRFTSRALRETMNLNNIHDVNFATALELGRRMGMVVPDEDEVHIFAVEVVDLITFSERMTPQLESSYPEFSEEIFREIETIVKAKGPDNRHHETRRQKMTTPKNDRNKVELAVLKKFGLRYSVLAAWDEKLREQGAKFPESVSKTLEEARVMISSGCFSVGEVEADLMRIEGTLFSVATSAGVENAESWLDILGDCMSETANIDEIEKKIGLPAVRMYFNRFDFSGSC